LVVWSLAYLLAWLLYRSVGSFGRLFRWLVGWLVS